MYGKIISAAEADKQFGPVMNSISMKTDELLNLISNTEKSVMLKIIDNTVYVLGDGRKVLYPASAEVKPDVVFHHYSKEMVLEIINSNAAGELAVEQRKDVLTITNGANTLEFAVLCPPFCG
jgi:hypothetical protein